MKTWRSGSLGTLGTCIDVDYLALVVTKTDIENYDLPEDKLGKIMVVYYFNTMLHLFDDVEPDFFDTWEEVENWLSQFKMEIKK